MRLIDADKLLEWGYVELGSAELWERLNEEIKSSRLDPTPPVQPDTPKPGDTVKHQLHGTGFVRVVEDGDTWVAFDDLDYDLLVKKQELEVIDRRGHHYMEAKKGVKKDAKKQVRGKKDAS